MTTAVLLLPLDQWVQQHLTTIIESTEDVALHTEMNHFMAQHAAITINGAHMSRQEFMKQIKAENAAEMKANITFKDSVMVPAKKGDDITAGSVGVFYKAVITSTKMIHGVHTSKQVIGSLNVVIETDTSIPLPHMPGYNDRRRVVSFNEVRLERPLLVAVGSTPAEPAPSQ
ncbi:hypothetical protein BDN70DRAFT_881838 [Pholiota conissans]|uniref:Uncharacterized protein n=1 Tax=Pholiota conissans TaxID=109636 RepID=A0A9P5YWB6_9AGAR|nr:hypothetical protein BDN70DRAFT_881838 [Pholiota conissans]